VRRLRRVPLERINEFAGRHPCLFEQANECADFHVTLGMRRNLEGGQEWAAADGERKLFQIKFGRLAQVAQCFLDGFALRGRSTLRVEGDIATFRGWGDHG
jgi:hypothetical protein